MTTRPCRSTTIRSDSRNISPVSWQDSRIVVPCSRSRVISRSTSAASCTPSEAVGSSSSSSRGLCAIARATATICRWPPDSVLIGRVVSRSGMPSRANSRAASLCSATSENMCLRRSLPSITFAAMSRFSLERQILPDDPDAELGGGRGNGRHRAPAHPDRPRHRGDVARDGPDQRGLARPRSPRPAPPPPRPAPPGSTPASAVTVPKRTVSEDTVSSGAATAAPGSALIVTVTILIRGRRPFSSKVKFRFS